jgi:hypothetical protein
MHQALDFRRAAVQCTSNSQRRVMMHASAVTATRPSFLKVTSSSTLWPVQQQNLHHQHSKSRHSRLVACQASPDLPASVPPATYDFSPHVDSTVLGGQLLVLAITIGAAAYWWWSVVPSARRTLAKEKRAGPLNEYLVELQQNPDKGVERWFYTDWLQQLQRRQQLAAQAAAKRAAATAGVQATTANAASTATPTAGAAMAGQQQQAASDLGSATGSEQQQQQQQQPRLPPPTEEPYVDKEPNFWSLDNPLLATAAMLAGIGVVSTVLHGMR